MQEPDLVEAPSSREHSRQGEMGTFQEHIDIRLYHLALWGLPPPEETVAGSRFFSGSTQTFQDHFARAHGQGRFQKQRH